jgi:hypothetical protein
MKLHTEKLNTHKMTREIEDLEFQNAKTKNFQSSHEERHILISSLVKLHTFFFEDPQNDKKKIKDTRTSKYENKKLSKFTTRKAHTPLSPCETSHNFF